MIIEKVLFMLSFILLCEDATRMFKWRANKNSLRQEKDGIMREKDEFSWIGLLKVTNRSKRYFNYDLIKDYAYPFDVERIAENYVNDFYTIHRISFRYTIIIINRPKRQNEIRLIYQENIRIQHSAKEVLTDTVVYKLSLYDLLYNANENIISFHVMINSLSHDRAYVYVEDTVEHTEGATLTEWGDPLGLDQRYPLRKSKKKVFLEPEYLTDPKIREHVKNHNLLLRFRFKGEATLTIKVYEAIPSESVEALEPGYTKLTTTTTTTTPSTTTTTTPTTTTTTPTTTTTTTTPTTTTTTSTTTTTTPTTTTTTPTTTTTTKTTTTTTTTTPTTTTTTTPTTTTTTTTPTTTTTTTPTTTTEKYLRPYTMKCINVYPRPIIPGSAKESSRFSYFNFTSPCGIEGLPGQYVDENYTEEAITRYADNCARMLAITCGLDTVGAAVGAAAERHVAENLQKTIAGSSSYTGTFAAKAAVMSADQKIISTRTVVATAYSYNTYGYINRAVRSGSITYVTGEGEATVTTTSNSTYRPDPDWVNRRHKKWCIFEIINGKAKVYVNYPHVSCYFPQDYNEDNYPPPYRFLQNSYG